MICRAVGRDHGKRAGGFPEKRADAPSLRHPAFLRVPMHNITHCGESPAGKLSAFPPVARVERHIRPIRGVKVFLPDPQTEIGPS
jgi:hypothetical protein